MPCSDWDQGYHCTLLNCSPMYIKIVMLVVLVSIALIPLPHLLAPISRSVAYVIDFTTSMPIKNVWCNAVGFGCADLKEDARQRVGLGGCPKRVTGEQIDLVVFK